MTTTRSPSTIPNVAISPNGQGLAPPGRGGVNVGRIALGVLLVVGLSAGFAYTYSQAGQRRSVLAVARPVPAGQELVAGDLKEALVSVDPALRPVPANRQASVIGRSAAVALVPGTLLSEAQLATGPLVPSGRDIVGLSLKAGQVPLGVRVGDRVIVIRTPTNPTSGNGSTVNEVVAPILAANGQVLAVDTASATNGGTTVLSVVVDSRNAASVAAAAASGQASLVIEGGQ